MTDVPADVESALRDDRRQTYWAIVARAYWRSLQSRCATWWAVLILFLTASVPFIANQAPYTAVIDGRREYPLFRDLTRVDLIWLVWGAAAVGVAIVFRRAGRKIENLDEIRARRVQWIAAIAGVAILASAAIALWKTDFLDVRNYHDMSRAGKLQSAVFAPLRWGFADQEPLRRTASFSIPRRTPGWALTAMAAMPSPGFCGAPAWFWKSALSARSSPCSSVCSTAP